MIAKIQNAAETKNHIMTTKKIFVNEISSCLREILQIVSEIFRSVRKQITANPSADKRDKNQI